MVKKGKSKAKVHELISTIKVKEVSQKAPRALEQEVQEVSESTSSFISSQRTETPTLRPTHEPTTVAEPAQVRGAGEKSETVREISYDSRNSNYTSLNPQAREYQDPMAAAGARGTAASATLRTDFEFAGRNELGQIDRQRHSILDERPEDKQYVGQEEQNSMRTKRRKDWQF